jgi:outer membrane receptor protein involved in Fe transport
VFLTGSLRGDQNSAFGTDFGTVIYPSLSTSWVVNEEPFFPEASFLNTLRLRAAYGEAGLKPRFRDAISFFSPVTVRADGIEVPAFTLGGTGNAELRPERSREIELGFDSGLFGDRVGLDFTYYYKRSADALIARRLAPSLGATTQRFENIGEVLNTGVEVALRGDVIDRDNIGLNFKLTGSTNRNELLKLGEGVEPIQVTGQQRHVEGYPLGGYWTRPLIGFSDKDNDGRITRVNCPGQPEVAGGPECEIEVGDTAVFVGNALPTRELSFTSDLTLFRNVRLSGLLDYRGGYKLYNATAEFRCTSSFRNCREAFDPDARLENQARYVARLFGTTSNDGYIEDASFVKLRELSLTLSGGQGVSLVLSGRNLATWTDYTGLDPELNQFGQDNFATREFLTQPPVKYFTARLNVNF